MKNLVIVESPTKARTISRFLGNGYEIKASMGHVMDLPKSKLGVDVEKDFEPMLEVIPDKEKIIRELKSAAKSVDFIILATDPDREGEAIASDIKDLLKNTKGITGTTSTTGEKFRRIVFHEITKEAIEEALKNPGDINHNLVDAQTARRVLDRLVGYKLSPMLWKKVRRGLSAGRVQSIALRLIVEREREIEKFEKEEYYTIVTTMVRSNIKYQKSKMEETEFELIEINGGKVESSVTFNLYDGEYKVTKTSIATEKSAQEIVADLKTKQFIITDVSQKETRRSPQPPFTTSTLQQDAARRFRFSGKRTMRVAQKLYEEGFITYHRTDSVILSKTAVSNMRNFIKKEYGEKYLPTEQRFYKTKQKLAQEAHEAIRPTKLDSSSKFKVQSSKLGNDAERIYELIWKRAVASQMSDAIIESTSVIVDSVQKTNSSKTVEQLNSRTVDSKTVNTDLPATDLQLNHSTVLPKQVQDDKNDSGQARMTGNNYRLKTNGSILVFEGFLKVNPQALADKRLPDFTSQEELLLKDAIPAAHETAPPPRYNDASLIATLEEKGIGRPSTYASIISVIEDRKYVERDPPDGGSRFTPTNVGVAVNDFLVANFSDIDNIDFTALMEDDLDRIAHGEREWRPMIKEFYGPFSEKLKKTEDVKRVKIEVEKTDVKCEKCGKGYLVVRIGRFGKFLSCERFPDCDFTKPFVEETNLTCPKCGHRPEGLASRRRRSVSETGPAGGKIIVKKTRKGKRFYGCSNYPACNFASWKLEDINNSSKFNPSTSLRARVQNSKFKTGKEYLDKKRKTSK